MGGLTVERVRKAGPGKHLDGEGLMLRVTNSGSKRWVLRTVVHGKRCEIGLGSAAHVSLADARAEARRMRAVARAGGDPRVERDQGRNVPTFEEAARTVWAQNTKGWKPGPHVQKWLGTLEVHAFPVMGEKRVSDIASADVLKAVSPIWESKNTTARKVIRRTDEIMRWAKAADYVEGDNPVDQVRDLYRRRPKPVEHRPAMSWQDAPAFYAALADRAGVAPLALRFIMLTAVRSGEAREARWSEFDLGEMVWTVPAERMKMAKAHRVPITPALLEILEQARGLSPDLVFPTPTSQKKPLSVNAFRPLFAKLKIQGATTHGFRSTFTDWCAEVAEVRREVAEAALAHAQRSATVRAYHRTDYLEQRRALMERWAAHLTGAGSNVVQLRA